MAQNSARAAVLTMTTIAWRGDIHHAGPVGMGTAAATGEARNQRTASPGSCPTTASFKSGYLCFPSYPRHAVVCANGVETRPLATPTFGSRLYSVRPVFAFHFVASISARLAFVPFCEAIQRCGRLTRGYVATPGRCPFYRFLNRLNTLTGSARNNIFKFINKNS